MTTREATEQPKAPKRQGKGRQAAAPVPRSPERRREASGPEAVRPKGNGSFPGRRGAGTPPPESLLAAEKSEGAPLPFANVVTADELAGLLGIAPRSVRSLAERGVVVRTVRGRYDLKVSVLRYCESLRTTAAGRGGDGVVTSLTAERSRLAKEQADAAALKNKRLRGELVCIDEVEKEWVMILRRLRENILVIPERLLSSGEFDFKQINIVRLEIRNTLDLLALDR